MIGSLGRGVTVDCAGPGTRVAFTLTAPATAVPTPPTELRAHRAARVAA